LIDMEKLLDGCLALVVGAGRGIGQAIAQAFAAQGADLVLAARSESELAATASLCQVHEVSAVVVKADVSDWLHVQRLVKAALGVSGRVDVLVNCAGVHGPIGPVADADPDDWVEAVQVNLCGSFYLCRALLPGMIARRQGKIILLAGGGATSPLPFLTAYAASKAAVVRFAETLAEEVKGYNIQVNAIAPGLVDTRLQDGILAAGERAGKEYEKARLARETGKGAVSPNLAAALAVFLASPQSGSLTGKLISAPYDPWREWAGQGEALNRSQLFTLRRLDPFTIKPLIKELSL
jgi:NAD(P)-dependent dehydrogenase (short-subunit alcohol dehydrogenase family)